MTTYNDDPTATYRGYRRQTLYCLYRLFDTGLANDCKIQPEGQEDLAILDENGEIIEIAQVKDYSDDLVLSDFKKSFWTRVAPFCNPGCNLDLLIVRFPK